MDVNFPLADKHCDDLDCLIKSCHETAQLLSKCRQAGVPMEQAENVNGQQLAAATKLKATFFPNKP